MKGHTSNISPLSKHDLQSCFFFRNLQPQFPEPCHSLYMSVLQQGADLSQ